MFKTSWQTGNSFWNAVRRTIWRSNNSSWGNGWISSAFCTRPVEAPPNWQESVTWNIPRILIKPVKFQNQNKRNPRGNGATGCLPTQVVQALKSRSGCKNSEKIWWMMKFQYTRSSHEASLEAIFKRRENLGKHSVCTHFPEDRNCKIC